MRRWNRERKAAGVPTEGWLEGNRSPTAADWAKAFPVEAPNYAALHVPPGGPGSWCATVSVVPQLACSECLAAGRRQLSSVPGLKPSPACIPRPGRLLVLLHALHLHARMMRYFAAVVPSRFLPLTNISPLPLSQTPSLCCSVLQRMRCRLCGWATQRCWFRWRA